MTRHKLTTKHKSNRQRTTAVFYREHPQTLVPELELIAVACGLAGYRSTEDFVRACVLTQSAKILNGSLDIQPEPQPTEVTSDEASESIQSGDARIQSQVEVVQGSEGTESSAEEGAPESGAE